MDIQISNIKNQLEQIGCSGEVFSSVCGIPTATWSRAQRGVITLSGPQILHLSSVSRALREIVEAARPLPLSFRSVADVKTLLEFHEALVLWRTVPSVIESVEKS